MIVDYEQNYGLYRNVLPSLEEGVAFLKTLRDKPPGRYEHGDMFAMVQQGTTKSAESQKLEAHKRYVDVQYMVEGEEVVQWANTKYLEVAIPYNEQKDILFYHGQGDAICVKPGMFYLVFPEDGHKPCTHVKTPTCYRKIVLKLKL
ncbi:MAG: YhcH/YjgK/YiaL family protein [Lachnospiraceae bacterium]|nr:YhcH/YjgK/YiaL family protein [Lachnospiraceae bacterium]